MTSGESGQREAGTLVKSEGATWPGREAEGLPQVGPTPGGT